MPELALDDVDRDALAGELDGMSVAELVGRKPASDAGVGGELAQLAPGGGDQRRPRVAPSMTQNSGPGGSKTRSASHASSCSKPNGSMPASRRLSPLPWRMSSEPRPWSMSVSLSASASEMRSPPRHSTPISARIRKP